MKKYKQTTGKEIQLFNNHLIQNQFSKDTIRMYKNYVSVFLLWSEEEILNPEEVKYTDIINFIEHLKEQEKSTGNINRHLTAIRHFYNFSDGGHSPAEGVILKGTKRQIPADLLEEKELKELYETYQIYTGRDKRNKAILGLLINQAVTTEELNKLEPKHLLLDKGKIIISGGKRSNQRTLKLQSYQILELYNYIENIRPEIIKNIHQKRPARKPDKINRQRINEQLFISINGNTQIKNSLLHLFRALKKKYPNVKHAKQIRISVITNKLKTHNLREVQYFAGHKWVSSTERYKLGNIEDLKKEVDKYHPLN